MCECACLSATAHCVFAILHTRFNNKHSDDNHWHLSASWPSTRLGYTVVAKMEKRGIGDSMPGAEPTAKGA